jgi:hypothetical protein
MRFKQSVIIQCGFFAGLRGRVVDKWLYGLCYDVQLDSEDDFLPRVITVPFWRLEKV